MNKQNLIADKILLFIAIAFLPNIFLFFLFNQNYLLNHLPYYHVIVVSVVLTVLSLLLFVLYFFITRNLQGSLIITSLFWLIFWSFGQSHSLALRYSAHLPNHLWLIFLIIGLTSLSIFIRIYLSSLLKVTLVFRFIAVFICVLFFINFIPSLNHRTVSITEVNTEESATHPLIKTEFYISPDLPHPDIYWFHLDGMMSLGTMERLFDHPQDMFREELSKRGFLEYEDARISSNTVFSLIALFSPSFYDNFLGAHLEDALHLYGYYQISEIHNTLAQAGIEVNTHVTPYHELIRALMDANYDVIFIAPRYTPHIFAAPFHRLYDIFEPGGNALYVKTIPDRNDDNMWNRFLLSSGNLFQMLTLSTPLSIISDQLVPQNIQNFSVPFHTEAISHYFDYSYSWHSQNLYRFLIDSYQNPSDNPSKFTFIAQYYTHTDFSFSVYMSSMPWHNMSYMEGYPMSFDYATSTMLNLVDFILERNPYAIIVLQSDHGFHPETDWSQIYELGFDKDNIAELSNSTFSAVRIPPQYGGLDAPLNPLNISRLLVNRFVGENYELLP